MSVRDGMRQGPQSGLTVVEFAVVIGIVGILAATTPPLVFQGARSFMFLPKAQVANQVAMEILHAIVEGSHSTLSSQTVRGLRYAVRQSSPPEPAIWFAETSAVGFLIPNDPSLTSDNQYVVLRLDGEQIRRSVYDPITKTCPPSFSPEEAVPYYAINAVSVMTPANPLFRYYRQDGTEVTSPGICSPDSTIRRVDIAFVAQTGGGDFDQGDARVDVMSSVAIRFP